MTGSTWRGYNDARLVAAEGEEEEEEEECPLGHCPLHSEERTRGYILDALPLSVEKAAAAPVATMAGESSRRHSAELARQCQTLKLQSQNQYMLQFGER